MRWFTGVDTNYPTKTKRGGSYEQLDGLCGGFTTKRLRNRVRGDAQKQDDVIMQGPSTREIVANSEGHRRKKCDGDTEMYNVSQTDKRAHLGR